MSFNGGMPPPKQAPQKFLPKQEVENTIPSPPLTENMQQSEHNSIPLSALIEKVVQQSYHDLVIMADILPNKTDEERKIELSEYALRTRQLYIYLLALLKWAKQSARPVERCNRITQLLDHQQRHFIDAADRLHFMSSEIVHRGCLPNFAIPAAIDVLTSGDYPRLPACIKSKIIDDESNHVLLSDEETISQLNTIIRHRLIMTKIPLDMTDFVIKNGMVRFSVKNEYEITLSVLGEDMLTFPWKVIGLKILATDPTSPSTDHVHPRQIEALKNIIQEKLSIENKNRPLFYLHETLHSFCLKLQIEILLNQAIKLSEYGYNNLKIISHEPGNLLKISYWQPTYLVSPTVSDSLLSLLLTEKRDQSEQVVTNCTIVFQVPENSTNFNPLIIKNEPEINCSSSNEETYDLEKIIDKSIKNRSKTILENLCFILNRIPDNFMSVLSSDGRYLDILVFGKDTTDDEKIPVHIDQQTGGIIIFDNQHLSVEKKDKLAEDFEFMLKQSNSGVLACNLETHFLTELRLHMIQSRIEKLLVNTSCSKIITNPEAGPADFNGLLQDDAINWFIPFEKYDTYAYLISLVKNENLPSKYAIRHGLCQLRQKTPTEVEATPDTVEKSQNSVFLTDYIISSIGVLWDDGVDFHQLPVNELNSNLARHFASNKMTFHTTFSQLISTCQTKIPFFSLAEVLSKYGFIHSGIVVDGPEDNPIGYCIRLLEPPTFGNNRHPESKTFLSTFLIDCVFRLQARHRGWMVELGFSRCPLQDLRRVLEKKYLKPDLYHPTRSDENIGKLYFPYDTLIDHKLSEAAENCVCSFMKQWQIMTNLYSLADQLVSSYNKSLSTTPFLIHQWTWKKLTIRYGKDFNFMCNALATMSNLTLKSPTVKDDHEGFNSSTTKLGTAVNLGFSRYGGTSSSNPHSLVQYFVTKNLDETGNMAALISYLSRTIEPLVSVTKIPLSNIGIGSAGLPQTVQTQDHHLKYLENYQQQYGPNAKYVAKRRHQNINKQRNWSLLIESVNQFILIYSQKYFFHGKYS